MLVKRHSLLVRVTHWINVVCLLFLLMSGLQIFNAHPALYWGHQSTFDDPVLSMRAESGSGGHPRGITSVLGHDFDTTGLLGLSSGADGGLEARGLPDWITLPSYQDLATGRRWHFFFAWIFVINGLVYVIASLANRHVWRDLVPGRDQLRGIGRSILNHLRLHFERVRDYNVLQKLTYLAVIFIVLPVLILAGLAMSPGIDAIAPWLPAAFGGRQSARTVHFICASLVVLFVLVHVVMVILSGVWNNLRSMVTGRYAVDPETMEGSPHV